MTLETCQPHFQPFPTSSCQSLAYKLESVGTKLVCVMCISPQLVSAGVEGGTVLGHVSRYETPRPAAHVGQPLEENHTHCTHIPGTHILTNVRSPRGVVGMGGCERGGSGLHYMISITNDPRHDTL